jgi:hypothetical protein
MSANAIRISLSRLLPSRSRREMPCRLRRLLQLGVAVCAMAGVTSVAAQEDMPLVASVPPDAVQPLPDAADGSLAAHAMQELSAYGGTGFQPPRMTFTRSRVDNAINPRLNAEGQPITELVGVSYRWWLLEGRGNVGLGVGTVGYLVPASGFRSFGPDVIVGSVPTVTVGWRYHLTDEAAVYADASRTQGLGGERRGGYYNTQVGVEWKNALAKMGFENGSLGFKFDTGYRMSLKLKLRHNGLGLYFRSTF